MLTMAYFSTIAYNELHFSFKSLVCVFLLGKPQTKMGWINIYMTDIFFVYVKVDDEMLEPRCKANCKKSI